MFVDFLSISLLVESLSWSLTFEVAIWPFDLLFPLIELLVQTLALPHILSAWGTVMVPGVWSPSWLKLLPSKVTSHFPGGSDSKVSAYNVGDPGSIPGSRRSPGEGNGNPLQYSCLENPMDRRALGYSPWGPKELDTTERLHFHFKVTSTVSSSPRGKTTVGS